MAKKTQIATGKRGGRIAGYHMKDGKMEPIYVGQDDGGGGGGAPAAEPKEKGSKKKTNPGASFVVDKKGTTAEELADRLVAADEGGINEAEVFLSAVGKHTTWTHAAHFLSEHLGKKGPLGKLAEAAKVGAAAEAEEFDRARAAGKAKREKREAQAPKASVDKQNEEYIKVMGKLKAHYAKGGDDATALEMAQEYFKAVGATGVSAKSWLKAKKRLGFKVPGTPGEKADVHEAIGGSYRKLSGSSIGYFKEVAAAMDGASDEAVEEAGNYAAKAFTRVFMQDDWIPSHMSDSDKEKLKSGTGAEKLEVVMSNLHSMADEEDLDPSEDSARPIARKVAKLLKGGGKPGAKAETVKAEPENPKSKSMPKLDDNDKKILRYMDDERDGYRHQGHSWAGDLIGARKHSRDGEARLKRMAEAGLVLEVNKSEYGSDWEITKKGREVLSGGSSAPSSGSEGKPTPAERRKARREARRAKAEGSSAPAETAGKEEPTEKAAPKPGDTHSHIQSLLSKHGGDRRKVLDEVADSHFSGDRKRARKAIRKAHGDMKAKASEGMVRPKRTQPNVGEMKKSLTDSNPRTWAESILNF